VIDEITGVPAENRLLVQGVPELTGPKIADENGRGSECFNAAKDPFGVGDIGKINDSEEKMYHEPVGTLKAMSTNIYAADGTASGAVLLTHPAPTWIGNEDLDIIGKQKTLNRIGTTKDLSEKGKHEPLSTERAGEYHTSVGTTTIAMKCAYTGVGFDHTTSRGNGDDVKTCTTIGNCEYHGERKNYFEIEMKMENVLTLLRQVNRSVLEEILKYTVNGQTL
jgi:hypothetical protein